MELNVNGAIYQIGQLGRDFLTLRDATDQPPAEGEIAMWINGDERRWDVFLPEGISSDKARTRIA
jgi:hypothetical protein